MTDKYYNFTLKILSVIQRTNFKKASHFHCERDCKDRCYFWIRQIFFKIFFAVSCETFAKGTAKISNLFWTSKNFFKNFASYWNSDYKTASSSFIVNPRLICKNRYFSNADAKVATFFEPANICPLFFEKSLILFKNSPSTYIY